MARACKPSGRIVLANWTPTSCIGELFKQTGQSLPPPTGVKSPARGDTEARLRELFGVRVDIIAIERRHFVFLYRSTAHWLEVLRTFYGPMQKAFGALDPAKWDSLAADLIALAEGFNRAADGSLVAPGEYLEVVIRFGK